MNDILPNSRAKEVKKSTLGGSGAFRMNWVPIYCANCGKEGGMVPEESKTFAFWLCENCFEIHGVVAGTMMMPDEVFWANLEKLKEK